METCQPINWDQQCQLYRTLMINSELSLSECIRARCRLVDLTVNISRDYTFAWRIECCFPHSNLIGFGDKQFENSRIVVAKQTQSWLQSNGSPKKKNQSESSSMHKYIRLGRVFVWYIKMQLYYSGGQVCQQYIYYHKWQTKTFETKNLDVGFG